MSDLREQVTRAMKAADDNQFHGMQEIPLGTFGIYADAALAIAEPIIRADERERLAQKAEDEFGPSAEIFILVNGSMLVPVGAKVADWLRAQQENDHD